MAHERLQIVKIYNVPKSDNIQTLFQSLSSILLTIFPLQGYRMSEVEPPIHAVAMPLPTCQYDMLVNTFQIWHSQAKCTVIGPVCLSVCVCPHRMPTLLHVGLPGCYLGER